jgi:hypothetical protein
MRVVRPCNESFDAMTPTERGRHCARCDREVIDLRRVPRKRALVVLEEIRASEGKACARVMATADGTAVFPSDPSPLARWVAPALLAGSLAACSAEPHPTAPTVVATAPISSGGESNTNGHPTGEAGAVEVPRGRLAVVPASTGAQSTAASNVRPVVVETMGDMAW